MGHRTKQRVLKDEIQAAKKFDVFKIFSLHKNQN